MLISFGFLALAANFTKAQSREPADMTDLTISEPQKWQNCTSTIPVTLFVPMETTIITITETETQPASTIYQTITDTSCIIPIPSSSYFATTVEDYVATSISKEQAMAEPTGPIYYGIDENGSTSFLNGVEIPSGASVVYAPEPTVIVITPIPAKLISTESTTETTLISAALSTLTKTVDSASSEEDTTVTATATNTRTRTVTLYLAGATASTSLMASKEESTATTAESNTKVPKSTESLTNGTTTIQPTLTITSVVSITMTRDGNSTISPAIVTRNTDSVASVSSSGSSSLLNLHSKVTSSNHTMSSTASPALTSSIVTTNNTTWMSISSTYSKFQSSSSRTPVPTVIAAAGNWSIFVLTRSIQEDASSSTALLVSTTNGPSMESIVTDSTRDYTGVSLLTASSDSQASSESGHSTQILETAPLVTFPGLAIASKVVPQERPFSNAVVVADDATPSFKLQVLPTTLSIVSKK